MKPFCLVFILGSCFVGQSFAGTVLSYFYGDNYTVGDQHANTLRIDQANSWKFGDNFLFMEYIRPASKNDSFYGEWHPRLSLSKISHKKIAFGPFKDLLVATELNLSSTGSRAYLYGLGTNISIPKFTFVKLNAYVRRNPSQPGQTYQVSTSWLSFFSLNKRITFMFAGFADYAGPQGTLRSNLLIKPRLMLDLGKAIKYKKNKLYLGLQYAYWYNRLGNKGVTESTPEGMISWIL